MRTRQQQHAKIIHNTRQGERGVDSPPAEGGVETSEGQALICPAAVGMAVERRGDNLAILAI